MLGNYNTIAFNNIIIEVSQIKGITLLLVKKTVCGKLADNFLNMNPV